MTSNICVKNVINIEEFVASSIFSLCTGGPSCRVAVHATCSNVGVRMLQLLGVR